MMSMGRSALSTHCVNWLYTKKHGQTSGSVTIKITRWQKPPEWKVIMFCVFMGRTESSLNGTQQEKKKWEGKKRFFFFFCATSLPLLQKRWSTLHKIYYLQAEILSSVGAIHHPGCETLWMIPPNYVDQPCLRGRFNLVTLVTSGTLNTPVSQHIPIFFGTSFSKFVYKKHTNTNYWNTYPSRNKDIVSLFPCDTQLHSFQIKLLKT